MVRGLPVAPKRVEPGDRREVEVPAVVRDVAYPHGVDYPGSPFQDKRDFLMTEVVVEDGSLDWTLGDFIE